MTDDEILTVVQAHKEGKQIQFRRNESGYPWRLLNDAAHVLWNFAQFQYKVVPEPRKPREWDVLLFEDGTITDVNTYNGFHIEGQQQVRVREVIEE